MPIPYAKLDFNTLMHHQGAYDRINETGIKSIPGWDMEAFEKSILGMGDAPFIRTEENIRALRDGLGELDKMMPFLRFREKGQHYAYELFLSPPPHWGSRGAPLFWAYTARQFTYDKLPMQKKILTGKYMDLAARFDIPYGRDDYVYVERFAAGGMSSGTVGGLFVKEGLAALLRRNRLYEAKDLA